MYWSHLLLWLYASLNIRLSLQKWIGMQLLKILSINHGTSWAEGWWVKHFYASTRIWLWSMVMYICHPWSDGSQMELTSKFRCNNEICFSQRPWLKKKSIESIEIVPMSTSSLLRLKLGSTLIHTFVYAEAYTRKSLYSFYCKRRGHLQKGMRTVVTFC